MHGSCLFIIEEQIMLLCSGAELPVFCPPKHYLLYYALLDAAFLADTTITQKRPSCMFHLLSWFIFCHMTLSAKIMMVLGLLRLFGFIHEHFSEKKFYFCSSGCETASFPVKWNKTSARVCHQMLQSFRGAPFEKLSARIKSLASEKQDLKFTHNTVVALSQTKEISWSKTRR